MKGITIVDMELVVVCPTDEGAKIVFDLLLEMGCPTKMSHGEVVCQTDGLELAQLISRLSTKLKVIGAIYIQAADDDTERLTVVHRM